MSDVSQGPGWWQASDGKWYAPELHPDYQPPAAEPPAAEPPAVDPTQPIAPIGGDATAPLPSSQPLEPPTSAFPTSPPPAVPPGGLPPGGPPPAVVPPGGGGGGGALKWVAIVVVLLLVGGGVAFALTRDSGGASKTAFCNAIKDNKSALEDNGDDKATLDRFDTAINKVLKASPKEIKGDVQAIVDEFNKVKSAVDAAGSDTDSQREAVSSAERSLDDTKLLSAITNVATYAKNNCAVGLFTDFASTSSFSSLGTELSTDSGSFGSDLSSYFGTDFSSAAERYQSCNDQYSDDPVSLASCVVGN